MHIMRCPRVNYFHVESQNISENKIVIVISLSHEVSKYKIIVFISVPVSQMSFHQQPKCRDILYWFNSY